MADQNQQLGEVSMVGLTTAPDNSAVNLESVQKAKKRNRRKERPRKKKSDAETAPAETESASCVASSRSSPLQNGNRETSSQEEVSASSMAPVLCSDLADGHSTSVPSPSKRRNKNKKNVALASIEKLSLTDDGEPPAMKGAAKNHKKVQEAPAVKFGSPSKAVRKSSGKPAAAPQNDESFNRCSKNSAEKRLKQGSQISKPQPPSHQLPSPSKQKRAGGFRNKSSQKEDPFLNENYFENFLQREQVEIMLQEGQPFLVKGFLRINQRNYREAYISNPDGSRDIMIEGVQHRNRALEGDEVAVFTFPEGLWKNNEGTVQKVGRVVHILTQVHHRQAVGTLKQMQDGNSRSALFSPRDSRVPRMRIPIKECPNPKDWENGLFHARIVEWNDVRFARGQLIGDSFGVQGDLEAETRAILLENEIDVSPYPQSLYVFFPESPYIPSDEDLKGREDLRKLCIFTIDPSTAKDLDDAVSCEKLENGNYKVGVHISDVSFFLREGTPLDKEVAKRATTTYLVQRAYHMLPREMTMLCSLLPGEDKLAFSVFWELTPEAEVVTHYFTRSVINSCAQLAYEHAQIMIEDPDHKWVDGELPQIYGDWTPEDLKQVVLSLQSLAVIMRKRRFDGGALRVDQTKLMFSLDEKCEPVSFSPYINKDSHRLIEEFMLLANITVATDLQKRFPSLAFLRCHEEPQNDMLQRLADILQKFGIILDISSAGSLHESIQRYNSNETQSVALNILCSKPMVRARYFCAASAGDVNLMRHYALNVPLYTHFTSPIRRYADVMVHRQLSALLGYCEEPKCTVDHMIFIAATCNKMKYCAKKAGEQSTELFLALWVKKHGVIKEEAVVIDVKDHSFDAVICSTGTNIRVYTDKLAAAVEFNNSTPELKITWAVAGGRTQQAYQVITMFSVVPVALRTSNTNLLKLEATLLPPSEGV